MKMGPGLAGVAAGGAADRFGMFDAGDSASGIGHRRVRQHRVVGDPVCVSDAPEDVTPRLSSIRDGCKENTTPNWKAASENRNADSAAAKTVKRQTVETEHQGNLGLPLVMITIRAFSVMTRAMNRSMPATASSKVMG